VLDLGLLLAHELFLFDYSPQVTRSRQWKLGTHCDLLLPSKLQLAAWSEGKTSLADFSLATG